MEWWLKKYEPRSLVNLIDHEFVISQFKRYLKSKNFPHLIICGPNGSGRLTATTCFLREFYGPGYKSNILLLNAHDPKDFLIETHQGWYELAKEEKKRRLGTSSEPTRMEILLSIIRNFPKMRAFSEIPFRTLVLYDADGMNRSMQQALRRVLETSTHTFRAILICNNASRIIEPIRSRCVTLTFEPFSETSLIRILRHVAENEKVILKEDALRVILQVSERNAVKAINLLQAASTKENPVSADVVLEIAKKIQLRMEMREVLISTFKGEFKDARDRMRNLLKNYRISKETFLRHFQDVLLAHAIPEEWRVMFSLILADAEFNSLDSNTEDIQLSALLARMASVYRNEFENLES
ncbi:MAG: replication factor C small subunit [Candidatus Helarchaeales archaeon]